MNMTVGPTQVATVGRLLCLSNLDEQIFTRYVFKNPSVNRTKCNQLKGYCVQSENTTTCKTIFLSLSLLP